MKANLLLHISHIFQVCFPHSRRFIIISSWCDIRLFQYFMQYNKWLE